MLAAVKTLIAQRSSTKDEVSTPRHHQLILQFDAHRANSWPPHHKPPSDF